MSDYIKRLNAGYEYCRKRVSLVPEVALVLGSGLGSFAESIRVIQEISYGEIDGFPVSTVPGHEGRFVFGHVDGVPVVLMQGRVHYYEGYSMQDVVLPVRLMRLLGAKILFLTNAAGGVNPEFSPGDFMLITDQISSFVPSPLIGRNEEHLGSRFPDMSEVYDRKLMAILRQTAEDMGITLKEGVYLQFSGPNYESPAEIRMARFLGADAVGMSTACEAVAAKHMGMKICGISCITNMACGILPGPLSHADVERIACEREPVFRSLVQNSIKRMNTGVKMEAGNVG